jgi:hypothetical protein
MKDGKGRDRMGREWRFRGGGGVGGSFGKVEEKGISGSGREGVGD